MLKGKHFFRKGKQEETIGSVVETSEVQSEVTKDSVMEVLPLPDEPEHISGEAEAAPEIVSFISVSEPSSDDTIDTSDQDADSQSNNPLQLSEEPRTELDPTAGSNLDIVYHQEQTARPVYIEDESDLLGVFYSLGFMSEKKPSNGEDSDPLLFLNPKLSAVGVFDGMGGAGSAIHFMGDQEKTGAYLASRKTKDSIEAFLESVCEQNTVEIDSLKYEDEFKAAILGSLNLLKKECPAKMKSGLKSAMIKEFPTTLAITTLRKRHNNYLLDSYWAGDSRNFILCSKGLFQITVDDLENRSDPYENLYSDSPLSNQVCADRPFNINHLALKPDSNRFAIISATDGCFGYYPTPMHFEEALLRNLQGANNIEEWKDDLKREFAEIAADDTSFSCIINGYDSFDAFKTEMKDRFCDINDFGGEYNLKVNELTDLKLRFEEKEAAFRKYKLEQWDKYKIDYMSLLNISDRND